MVGLQPPLFPWSEALTELTVIDDCLWRSKAVLDQALVHLQWAVRRQKEQSDRHCPEYTPGQWVWLSTKDLCPLIF